MRLSSHPAEATPDLVVLPKHQFHNVLSEMAKERIRILLLFTVLGLVIFCCITSLHYAPGFSWTCTSSMTTSSQASSRNVLGKRPQILSVSDSSGRCNCSMVLYSSIPSRDSSREVEPSLNCSCIQATDHTSILNHSDCPAKVDLQNPSIKEELKCSSEDTVVKTKHESHPAAAGPWYAQGKAWHYPATLPRCSMDACFNYSRCENNAAADHDLLIYSYDSPSSPVRYFSRINESKWHTNDPQAACIFFVFVDTTYPWPPHPSSLPHWNGGLNHVIISFADKWTQWGPHTDATGFASIMASDIHETTYRAGFDISIPLPGKHHFRELQELKPLEERKYFAAFRGLRYLGFDNGSEEAIFRSFDSFRNMHNGKDVIVATSCNHATNNMKREKDPILGIHCDEDDALHANYSFTDLMNTTFGLVPAGVSPSSYRFIEVLSAGAIPVLIADNYVKPFDTLIHWHRCLIQFPTSQMHRILPVLRALTKDELVRRQRNCLRIYDGFLRDDDALLQSAIHALKARFLGAASPNFNDFFFI